MTFNKDSNGFTFVFSIVMVVVVGTLLAIAAMGLKPYQEENKRQEKMKNILQAVMVMTAKDDMKGATPLFKKYVIERIVINSQGEVISAKRDSIGSKDSQDAFNIDVKKEYKMFIKPVLNKYKKDKEKKEAELAKLDVNYPLFKCELDDGSICYVIPMVGTGLWGPIWGYMGMRSDMESVYAAVFDHKTETPGLGAEINQQPFQSQFPGKKMFNEDGSYHPIDVTKNKAKGDYEVDGITGGTITSNGVDEMIDRTLKVYIPFFEANKNK